jgi:hypothetical protein
MFLAVIALTFSSFRHYIMFNHQNLPEDDNEEDDETSNILSSSSPSRQSLFVSL